MSIPGQAQAPPVPRARRRRGWWVFLLTALLVLLSLPVFAAFALALRLWIGPIDVTGSARRLLAANDAAGLEMGRVRLAWAGWKLGPSAPLGLIADDLRLDDARIGRGTLAHAVAAFDLAELLRGRLTPLALSASDGAFSVDARPLAGRAGAARAPRVSRLDFGGLAEISLARVALTGRVFAGGRPCRAEFETLRLTPQHRPAAIGVTGQIAVRLSCQGLSVALAGGAREGPQGGIVWHLASGTIVPGRLAAAAPLFSPLAGVDVPVRLDLDAALSGGFGRFMLPRTLDLTADLGAGRIGRPGGGVPIRGGVLHLSLALPDQPGGMIRVGLAESRVRLDEGEATPELLLAGALSQDGRRIRGSLRTRIARFDFAGLGDIWPADLAPGARRWVSGNIVAGTGHALDVTARLASEAGWPGLDLAGLEGGLEASALTLFWLRPIAPLRGMDARLVFEGPDTLRIESRHAVETVPGHGDIQAGATLMRITGLSRKDQFGRIDTTLQGGLAELLALLADPRLKLLSRHPLPFADPSGSATVRLGLSIPLLDRVRADDIPIRADATLTGIHLGGVVLGRDLDAASLAASADNAGLQLRGQGMLAGVPASLAYAMDFRAGGADQRTETATVAATLGVADLRRAGLETGRRMEGTAGLALSYARHRSGAARIDLALDLTKAGLTTPLWRKPAGRPARASGVVTLQDGHLVAVEALRASGEGMLVEAHADIVAGTWRGVVVDRFAIGRSRGAGRIALAGAGAQRTLLVALRGAALDLAPYVGRTPEGSAPEGGAGQPAARGPDATAERGMRWRADLAFRTVLFGPTRSVDGVRFHAEAQGERISTASLAIAAPTSLQASLSPQAALRHLQLQAPDAGALLAALGIATRIEGGSLSLDGTIEDRPDGARLTALARIGRFTVHDAPLAARLARDLSIYGFLRGAPSRQIVVTRFEIPFTLQGDTLRLTGAHASNDALGATLRGPIDLGQETLDLRGTVVPSYLLNALPGRLPGVGRMFSPEQGGGLLAATLRITGPIERPKVKVNPLALLAPGILRRLLFD